MTSLTRHPLVPRLLGFIRYGLAGLVSLALIMSITALGKAVGLSATASYAVALAAAFAFNFQSNRHFVFAAADACGRRQARRYVTTAILTRAVEWVVFAVLHPLMPDLVLIPAIQLVSMLLKFELFRRFVFVTPVQP